MLAFGFFFSVLEFNTKVGHGACNLVCVYVPLCILNFGYGIQLILNLNMSVGEGAKSC